MLNTKIMVNLVDSRTILFGGPWERRECFKALMYWLRSGAIDRHAERWPDGFALKLPDPDVLARVPEPGITKTFNSLSMGDWSMRLDDRASALADIPNARMVTK